MESQLIIDNQSVAAQSGATFTRNHPHQLSYVTSYIVTDSDHVLSLLC